MDFGLGTMAKWGFGLAKDKLVHWLKNGSRSLVAKALPHIKDKFNEIRNSNDWK
jgi:hypothetical protein